VEKTKRSKRLLGGNLATVPQKRTKFTRTSGKPVRTTGSGAKKKKVLEGGTFSREKVL